MLSKDLEATLNNAFESARVKRHEFMTVEHLLLALLDDEAAMAILQACAADVNKLRQQLIDFVDSTTPLIPNPDHGRKIQQPWDSSVCCSGRFFMCKVLEEWKSQAPTYWLLFLVNRKVRQCIF